MEYISTLVPRWVLDVGLTLEIYGKAVGTINYTEKLGEFITLVSLSRILEDQLVGFDRREQCKLLRPFSHCSIIQLQLIPFSYAPILFTPQLLCDISFSIITGSLLAASIALAGTSCPVLIEVGTVFLKGSTLDQFSMMSMIPNSQAIKVKCHIEHYSPYAP